jgi:geranylgeranyl diphosphate synthase type I
MTLKNLQGILIPEIESALKKELNATDFGGSPELGQMLRYHLGWESEGIGSAAKGKRLRPLITLLATGAYGEYPNKSMPAAVAVELLHNFTLIHDDIEDQSPLRHGRPTLWKRYGAAQAINAGDALFSIAQLSMLDLVETCGQYVVLDAMREFNRTCLHLTRGQHLDISFEHEPDVTVSAYMEMIEGKTGALIAFAASLGPLAAGETLTEYRKMAEYGTALGLAFQVQDDILGIWGDPEITGKSAASDILTRKKTLPNLLGLAECPEFRALWQQDNLSPDQIVEMAKLLESCGVRAQVEQQSEDLTTQAFSVLDSAFQEKNDYAEALYELTGFLLKREA